MGQEEREANGSDGLDASAGEVAQSAVVPATPQSGVERVTMDASLPPEAIANIVQGEKESSRNGLAAGLVTVVLGVILLLVGVTGTVDITFQSGKTTGHVLTGMVGVVVALIGCAIVYLTRFRVDVLRSSTPSGKPGAGGKGGGK